MQLLAECRRDRIAREAKRTDLQGGEGKEPRLPIAVEADYAANTAGALWAFGHCRKAARKCVANAREDLAAGVLRGRNEKEQPIRRNLARRGRNLPLQTSR